MERACKKCLDRISQKKTYYTVINMLKRKSANEYYHMLPHYEGKYELKQNKIDSESAREILMKEDGKMAVKRRFDWTNNMIESKSYNKYEDIPEIKEKFIYGFKHIKTDKIDNFKIIGCESDELYENDKLYNFCSIKFKNRQIEKRDCKITGWPFMTLVEKNNILKARALFCSWKWC